MQKSIRPEYRKSRVIDGEKITDEVRKELAEAQTTDELKSVLSKILIGKEA